MTKFQRAAGVARIENDGYVAADMRERERHASMRKSRQADEDHLGCVDRCGQIARHQSRLRKARTEYTIIGHAVLRLERGERLRRAAPETNLVTGGDKLHDGGCATGAAPHYGNVAHLALTCVITTSRL